MPPLFRRPLFASLLLLPLANCNLVSMTSTRSQTQNSAQLTELSRSLVVDEDTSVTITMSPQTYQTGDRYELATVPAHGTVFPNEGATTFTYRPVNNYFGPDSFTYRLRRGSSVSNVATVSIAVQPIDDPPTAAGQSLGTDEDTPLAITLFGADIDSATLTFAIATAPAHGTLSAGTGNQRTYTPAPNYNGTDSFRYTVSDGQFTSAPATVTIVIGAEDDAPTADSKTIATSEDTAAAVTLSGNDPEGATLSFTVLTSPAHGTLTGSGTALTYTPAANWNGTDSFTYRCNDGHFDSNVATITLNVASVNDAPTANPQTLSTGEDTPLTITLTASDPEGFPSGVTFGQFSTPLHGTVALDADGVHLVYTPAANYSGQDSFTFRAFDGGLWSNAATILITITPHEDAPIPSPQTITLLKNTIRDFNLRATDPDGDTINYQITTPPAHGTLTPDWGDPRNTLYHYQPATDFVGTDTFQFNVNDGTLTSSPATVTVNVLATPDGLMDLTFNHGDGFDGEVYAVAVQPDDKILVGGNFTHFSGYERHSLVRLNSDGTLDNNFGPLPCCGMVRAIQLAADGTIWVADSAVWHLSANGTPMMNTHLDPSFNNEIYKLLVDATAWPIVVGSFNQVRLSASNQPINVNGIARTQWYNLDPSFNIGVPLNAQYAAVLQSGKIIVGAGLQDGTHGQLTRLNGDGSLDASFATTNALDGRVRALTLAADGKILAGGDFSHAGGAARARIARFQTDGTPDPAFDPGTGFGNGLPNGGTVYDLKVDSAGRVLAGGLFTQYNGAAVSGLVRLGTDGARDAAFDTATGFDGEVHAIGLQSNGKVIVGGAFTGAEGELHPYLIRLYGH